ncbi:MAG: amino acid ABC transporter ATP-binding protein [Geminicoccaceae bacterium]|nr:amino acid ABC transporter ATP-binding protein [Geminicoccaceae bacterium]
MTDPLLKIEGLRKSFGALEVLHGVDLALDQSRKVAIIGPSGSGKTTILRCVNYLEVPTGGHVWLDGELIGEKRVGDRFVHLSERELAPQRREMGFVFQNFYLWPHLTVLENVALGPWRVQGMARREAMDLAETMLDKVHMGHKRDEYPERLSGGQQQRVGMARALAQQPKVILFDEPTSALDPELVGEVLSVIQELAAEGRTMILVTHEIRFARDVADVVVFMDGGRIVEQGPPAAVIDDPRHERTRRFLGQLGRG